MNKKKLLNGFGKFRDSILEEILEYVKSQENQVAFLNNRPDYRISESEEDVITQIYLKLYIEDNILKIEYEYGEGFEPSSYETIVEELWVLSANEIYEIVLRINE